MGLVKAVSMLWKAGSCLNRSMEPLIMSIPVMRTAKPMSIRPRLRFLSLFANIRSITPTRASMGAKVMGFKRVRKKLSPCIPVSVSIQEVSVVPTWEPIIMPKVSANSIIPEFTRPTSMTVMADDD